MNELKPLLSKETFCKALQLIREQEAIYEEVGAALSKVGDGHFVLGSENKFHEALLMVLKESVNDQYDYIGWWLYEHADYKVWTSDGSKEWVLEAPEALYDFIVRECQDRPESIV